MPMRPNSPLPHKLPLAHRILWTLYDETEKLLTSHSIRQYLLVDLRRELAVRRRERQQRSRERDALIQRLSYLKRAACILETGAGPHRVWQLTAKGKLIALTSAARALARIRRTGHRAAAHRPWLVVFDIPEEQRRVRDLFRRVLYDLGGRMLQRSVFLVDREDDCRLVRHIVKTAKLRAQVLIARLERLER